MSRELLRELRAEVEATRGDLVARIDAELAKPEPTRFDKDMDGSMEPSEDGRWVRYEDVA